MVVEVSSDEEGFKGAWFTATIMRPVGTRFCVEYHDLRTDDETALLQETVDPIHIRPIPPETRCGPDPLRLLEEVDAYHNDGWWAGVVSKVVGKNRYVVYFRQWKEEMEFGHDVLRPHFDWVGGRWVRLSLVRLLIYLFFFQVCMLNSFLLWTASNGMVLSRRSWFLFCTITVSVHLSPKANTKKLYISFS